MVVGAASRRELFCQRWVVRKARGGTPLPRCSPAINREFAEPAIAFLSTGFPHAPRPPQSRPATHEFEQTQMQDISKQLAQHIARTIAAEIGAQTAQALAAIALLDEGASVPFIARYRKEVTGGLDDTQLRNLETR